MVVCLAMICIQVLFNGTTKVMIEICSRGSAYGTQITLSQTPKTFLACSLASRMGALWINDGSHNSNQAICYYPTLGTGMAGTISINGKTVTLPNYWGDGSTNVYCVYDY